MVMKQQEKTEYNKVFQHIPTNNHIEIKTKNTSSM